MSFEVSLISTMSFFVNSSIDFNDSIKTEGFLLCSVDYHKIYELYKGLDNLKFYHMKQKADRLKKRA